MFLDAIFAESTSFWGILLSVVGAILLVVFILALCACQKLKHRSPLDEIFVEENGNAVTNQPAANKPSGNGAVTLSASEAELSKLKVPTLQRKLPDIPVLPVSLTSDTSENATETQSPDNGSELYATVDSSTKLVRHPSPQQLDEILIHDGKSNADVIPSEPSTSFHNPTVQPQDAVALTKQLGETTQSSGDSDAEHPYSHIQPHNYLRFKHADHPYDWLKGQTSEERDTDTDNYDDPHVYAQSRDWTNTAQEPPPPPIPEKRYDIDNNIDELLPASQLTAANAVSGRVSASEIPYVTSPVDSPTHQPVPVPEPRPISPLIEPQYNNGSETSTGSGPNVRYTSISVREPLANLRAHPQLIQQESYYAVVSDDDADQTYAEIHASQTTSSDSPAYAAVEFAASNRELPPVPPPVESLRSLRSKPTDSVSIPIAFNASVTDSKPSSSLTSTNEMPSGSSFVGSNDLYSTIEKRRASDRKTIHTSVPHSYLHLDNIEDMYAKVLKNKRLSLHQDFTSSDGLPSISNNASNKPKVPTNPPSSPLPFQLEEANLWSFSDNRRPRSMIVFGSSSGPAADSLISSSSAHNVSEFESAATADCDPDYEEVGQSITRVDVAAGCDPGYEKIREKFTDENSDPGYETVKGNANDPGYESVILMNPHNDNFDPAYETVNIHAGNLLEPGYEIVGLNQSDPGYEQIRKNYVDNEPGYETIARPMNKQQDSESGYERINPVIEEANEPGYEQVARNHVNEPGYEELNPKLVQLEEAPDYEVVNFNRIKAVGFPNGNCDEYDEAASNDPGYEKVTSYDNINTKPVDINNIGVVVIGDTLNDTARRFVETNMENVDLTQTLRENGVNPVLTVNHATMNYVFNPCFDFENSTELEAEDELLEIVEPPYAVVNKTSVKMETNSDMTAVDVTNHEDKT